MDPYVSRPTFLQHLFKLRPNENLVRSMFPRADEVLVGHSHSDHILDAPLVCKLTNAKFVGSESACIVAYGAGVPFDKIVNVAPKGEPVRKDPITTKSGWIKAVPSLHGNYTPLPGDIPGSFPKPGTDPLPEHEFQFPCRVQKFLCGEVLDWYLEMNGCRIVHIDSANICEDELAGCSADVLCLCAAGWTKDYVQRALDLVQPKVVIPCHWDYFLRPFHKVPKEMRGSNMEKLLPEIEKRGVKPAVLPFGGSLGFSKAS